MKKLLSVFLISLAIAAGAYWYFNLRTSTPPAPTPAGAPSGNKPAVAASEAKVNNPEPLRAKKESPKARLTAPGVLKYTNQQRQDNGGLPPLSENGLLDEIATERLADMFGKQYFAHVAPDGGSASRLADSLGYRYVVIGENIALGNFENDKELVQAWMDSPGHRANILNDRYTEIGIAVGPGVFEGKNTWLAVQVFGRPTSACPAIDAALKQRIDLNESGLSSLEARSTSLQQQMEALKPVDRENADAYNGLVAEYNALVPQINGLIETIRADIEAYNAQVRAFNACATAE